MISFCEFSVDGHEWMNEWISEGMDWWMDADDDTVVVGGGGGSSSTMEMKHDGCDEWNQTSGNQLLQAHLT
jgi:hypothetical protein